MTKAEYEAMVAAKDAGDGADATKDGDDATNVATTAHPKDKIAEVGNPTKKRKVAKVISEHNEEEAKRSAEGKESETRVVKKVKKKAKPVKLSFGDDEA